MGGWGAGQENFSNVKILKAPVPKIFQADPIRGLQLLEVVSGGQAAAAESKLKVEDGSKKIVLTLSYYRYRMAHATRERLRVEVVTIISIDNMIGLEPIIKIF